CDNTLTCEPARYYELTRDDYRSLSANISPKTLTVSGLSASNKCYDATTAATLSGTAALLTPEAPGTGLTTDGKAYTGDTVSLAGTAVGTFAGKDVGTGIAVTVSGNTLSGDPLGDYKLTPEEQSC